jgi:O-antigen ligase
MATKVANPERQALNWLLIGGSLVSIFFWATSEDPFNAPKSWILYSVGLWLLGWVSFQLKSLWSASTNRPVLFLSGIFSLCLLISFLATDMKLQGFFGDYARRTGFLSYFALIVFFVVATFLIKFSNLHSFDRVTLIIGFIIGSYGFLQHCKIDPIKWNNPYNSVLSTLGNPDFAAAVMAIFMVLAFGLVVNSTKTLIVRVWAAVNIVILLITIIFSQVRQGLLAGAIGISLIVLVWIHQRQRIVAWVLSGFAVLVGLTGLIGMLNEGPLKGFFYKASVTYRGDYWRAGIRMFKSHPWFGVGLDRYGAYFRQYRDATQALRRGPDIVSNAAHDVPIQLAATGGIFVLLAFLAITGFILWRGVVGLRNTTGITQIVVATFSGAWLAYEAQSLISIDNVGIAIWGWVLGGVVVALSNDSIINEVETRVVKSGIKTTRVKEPISLSQPLVSGMLFVLAIAVCIPMFLSDSSLRALRTYAVPKANELQGYLQLARKPLTYGFQDPHAKVSVAVLIAQAGAVDEAKSDLKAVLDADPRNFDALESLALVGEQTNNAAEAVGYRRRIAEIDPWNYKNLLQLGEDLKKTGDMGAAKAIVGQIDAFASQTAESRTAHRELGA